MELELQRTRVCIANLNRTGIRLDWNWIKSELELEHSWNVNGKELKLNYDATGIKITGKEQNLKENSN